MLTDVDAAYDGWGTPDARPIRESTPDELARMEFAAGSMGPKVEAACRFVRRNGGFAAIGSLADAPRLLRREAGTTVARAGRGRNARGGPDDRGYDARRATTPWEEERLLIFSAAELARRHRAAGLQLNAPEAVALMCDAMLEAARAGASYAEVEAAGRAAVAPGEVMAGVADLVTDIRLEVLLEDGTRLIVLANPLGRDRTAADGPGAISPSDREPQPIRPPTSTASPCRSRTPRAGSSGSRRISRSSGSTPGSHSTVPAHGAAAWTCRPAPRSGGRRARRGR